MYSSIPISQSRGKRASSSSGSIDIICGRTANLDNKLNVRYSSVARQKDEECVIKLHGSQQMSVSIRKEYVIFYPE